MTATLVRPTRRTLVRGAAWSVPVVALAAAAPAFAASPCDPLTNRTLDWDGANTTYSRAADRRSATAIYDPDLAGPIPSLTMNLTTAYNGNTRPGTEAGSTANSLAIQAQVGGLGVSGMALEQSTTSATGQGRADRGAYTLTFSRPVSNLQFTVTDIDSLAGDFWDVLEPSAGYSVVSRGSNVASDFNGPGGTQRFYSVNNNTLVDNTTGSGGNVTLRYAGPISSVTLTYWNGYNGTFANTVDTDQVVYLSDMTFDYDPC